MCLGGVAAVVAGLLMAAASSALGDIGGVYVVDRGEIVGLRLAPVGFAVAALAAVAAVVLVGGALAAVVAWVATLANVHLAARRGWFVGLLVLGLPTLGVAAVVAYVLAGPDRGPSTV
jgi:hypothetical protein